MSTTHSVGKRAYVLTDDKGQDWWLLEEQTYSSNTFPQTPRWCYGYFGDYSGMIESIITWSATCEGGCLSGAGRDLKAESYIRQWKDAVEKAIPVRSFNLNIEYGSYTRNVPKDLQQELTAILEQASIPYCKETGSVYGKVKTSLELLSIKKILELRQTYIWRIINGVEQTYSAYEFKMPLTNVAFPATVIGKITGNRTCVFFKLNEKSYFDDGWGAIGDVIQEIATKGISLQNAITVIRKLRVDLAGAVEYKGPITILRPKSDRIDKVDQERFKDETLITFDSSEYPARVSKDYFLVEKIDAAKLIESHAASMLDQGNKAMQANQELLFA
jgi:hypothetical protein